MPGKQKENWFKPWVSVQNAVLVLSGCFAVALLGLNKSELASWVQAVGSIASIWGAFAISQSQMAKINVDRVKERISLAHMYHSLVDQAQQQSKNFSDVAEHLPVFSNVKSYMSGRNKHILSNLYDALKSFQVKDIGSERIAVSHVHILSSIGSMLDCMERLQTIDDGDANAVALILAGISQENFWLQAMWEVNLNAYDMRIGELNREVGNSTA